MTFALEYETVAPPSDLHLFEIKTWTLAYCVGAGLVDLQDAVDGLQEFAASTGLADIIGQDRVQATMAEAFRRC